jgi:hypothetical protein
MGEVLGPSLWDTLLGVRLRQLLCRGHGFPNQQVLSCVFRRVNPLNGLVFRKGPHLNRDCVMRKSFVFNKQGVKLEWRLDKAQVFFLQRLESLRVWRGRE